MSEEDSIETVIYRKAIEDPLWAIAFALLRVADAIDELTESSVHISGLDDLAEAHKETNDALRTVAGAIAKEL